MRSTRKTPPSQCGGFSALFVGQGDATEASREHLRKLARFSALFVGQGDATVVASPISSRKNPVSVPSSLGREMQRIAIGP